MHEFTCTHKWDWRKYGPCTMCGPAPIIAADCTATRNQSEGKLEMVYIGEIIEQVRALDATNWYKNQADTINAVLEILERYR